VRVRRAARVGATVVGAEWRLLRRGFDYPEDTAKAGMRVRVFESRGGVRTPRPVTTGSCARWSVCWVVIVVAGWRRPRRGFDYPGDKAKAGARVRVVSARGHPVSLCSRTGRGLTASLCGSALPRSGKPRGFGPGECGFVLGGGGGAHGGKDGKPGSDDGKGGKPGGDGGKRGKPGGDGGKDGKRGGGGGKRGKRGVGGEGQHLRTAKAMADSAAMAVDGGVADGESVVDGAHVTAGGHPEVDCSTNAEVSRQSRPRGSYYAHAEPVKVVVGVPRVTHNRFYDMCVRNRALAHTRRVYAQYKALPDFVDVMAQAGLPDRAGDRVADVHGDPYFENQGPQRRMYDVITFYNEVVRYQVPLHPFHHLVYANALLFPVKVTETIEAAANSFCRLLRNWPNAVFLKRDLAVDLSVSFGHDSGLEPYLHQLALVKHEEDDNVEDDRSPRVNELPKPFRLPMFPSDHHRAADTRFFRGRELIPTAWAAAFLRAPRTFNLSHWLPPTPAWEPHMGLWVATPVVVSYLADALRNAYSSVWQEVYSEWYCNLVAAWVHTL